MKEYLDSDRLNFLVWRYLLESNYREAATKLQKEWGIKEPHRHFDFAQHSDVVPDSQTEFGFFGPVTLPPPKTYARPSSRIQHQKDNQEEDGEADADGEADDEVVTKQEDPEDVSMEDSTVIITEDATARKRPLSTHLPNGTAKKPKLAENGDDTTIPMSMDIDSGEAPGSNHAYPSPLEGDETSATQPHTDGPEQGTQEKTKDLTTDTIYLDLAIEKPRPVRTFETDSTDALVHVAYDDRALIAAASSDTGTITLIDGNGSKRKISAHTHPITALKWQPEALAGAENRLLASAGEDGAVLVWDPKCLETKPKKFLTMSGGPIVALAFSPDGAYLAGATALHVYIWKVGDTASIPYAKWKRTPHPGWNGPTPSGENEDTFEHCLAWDSTGQKVAYGVNSRLAVISFR
ncbi:F-box-like/WD repeat-containing protein TBL1X [Ceratocystis platani]|uniref:F-box-like/WD repeat-containing protein TBL1X n=1 Tax=Ceratocystis fimbriata f. sp. platani TaxID=88771 RepID=A0A0F8B485_CERFI|nr:F-box-like/WD repeat-containing protein TBL1X [Ceratocystis platani]